MLKILKSGFYTTIQDSGRKGFRNKGVPVAGAMDSLSAETANKLLENAKEAAVLEITMTGPTLLFEDDTYICLGGAELSATLNNEPIENYKVIKVNSNDILSYGKLEKGFRAYLAISGGFKSEEVLKSRSQFIPISSVNCLKDNQEIAYDIVRVFEPKISEAKMRSSLFDKSEIEVFPGPEFEMFSDQQLMGLFSDGFTIAKENNRMAYQLEEKLQEHSYSQLTSATLPGTVQLTPTGKIIILMKDGQTTGGYPRILQLSLEAISILAQKKTGDSIRFKLTNDQ